MNQADRESILGFHLAVDSRVSIEQLMKASDSIGLGKEDVRRLYELIHECVDGGFQLVLYTHLDKRRTAIRPTCPMAKH